MFSGEREDRVRALRSQRGKHPGDHKPKVVIRANVEKGTQHIDRTTADRRRERDHPWLTTKAHFGSIDHAPAAGRDLDSAPRLVGQIDVDPVTNAADPNEDLAQGPVEVSLGLNDAKRRFYRVPTQGAAGRPIE
jgi:hypothetical protein